METRHRACESAGNHPVGGNYSDCVRWKPHPASLLHSPSSSRRELLGLRPMETHDPGIHVSYMGLESEGTTRTASDGNRIFSSISKSWSEWCRRELLGLRPMETELFGEEPALLVLRVGGNYSDCVRWKPIHACFVRKHFLCRRELLGLRPMETEAPISTNSLNKARVGGNYSDCVRWKQRSAANS